MVKQTGRYSGGMAEVRGDPASDWSITLEPSWLGRPAAVPQALISEVASLLHRPVGGPGYAVIKAAGSDLRLESVRDFQVALLQGIWDEMESREWMSYRSNEVRLNRFEANDGRLPRDLVGDVLTFKRLHFDPYSLVFGHLYEPPSNCAGGVIELVDVSGYLRDTGLQLTDVFAPLHAPGHNGRLVALEEHRRTMLSTYAQAVSPPSPGEFMILLIRNDPIAGVAHEIREVTVVDPTAPWQRRFYRTSFAPHH